MNAPFPATAPTLAWEPESDYTGRHRDDSPEASRRNYRAVSHGLVYGFRTGKHRAEVTR